ncbi:MAG: 3-deoxy-manno-octulosonate cytidylyltransferase [Desulfovibrio sp.]|nr:3-deoxy-manno-octulosonate cytidylyltransferase [Desulfovibrio sp.]
MRVIAVIPARYHSTRLPGKPLLEIAGKAMIVHVLEKAKQVRGLDDVLVATDDDRIAEVVRASGGKVCMTSPDCASGSDRLQEVAKKHHADVYINIQGDEPLLDPAAIEKLVNCMRGKDAPSVATLAYALPKAEEQRVHDPNLVKVVCDEIGHALYFSRSPIPFVRDAGTDCTYFVHIGVYAYSREALERFGQLAPSSLEQIEKLEQLRLLQAGIAIKVVQTQAFGPGVDTAEDLAAVRAIVEGKSPQPSLEQRLSHIKLIITDVDGVLTDGGLFYGPEGESLKRFNAKDGLGCVLAQKKGLRLAVLSGRDCEALRRRLKDLGIAIFRLGRLEKRLALQEIFAESGCDASQTVFLGDDLTDLPAFEACALGVCVADAQKEVREAADLVLESRGGQGALRELLERVLASQGLGLTCQKRRTSAKEKSDEEVISL